MVVVEDRLCHTKGQSNIEAEEEEKKRYGTTAWHFVWVVLPERKSALFMEGTSTAHRTAAAAQRDGVQSRADWEGFLCSACRRKNVPISHDRITGWCPFSSFDLRNTKRTRMRRA